MSRWSSRNKAQVQLIFTDGTPYGEVGSLDFSDVSVDPTTGALAFRGLIPNPDRQLLPGLFVNLRVTIGQLNQAFLVPQVAVQRDATARTCRWSTPRQRSSRSASKPPGHEENQLGHDLGARGRRPASSSAVFRRAPVGAPGEGGAAQAPQTGTAADAARRCPASRCALIQDSRCRNFSSTGPVFAWVIAILITRRRPPSRSSSLPAEAYPDIAPPQINVSTSYPGANATPSSSTVTQVIEQQLTGIDHLLYFTSSSSSDGERAASR